MQHKKGRFSGWQVAVVIAALMLSAGTCAEFNEAVEDGSIPVEGDATATATGEEVTFPTITPSMTPTESPTETPTTVPTATNVPEAEFSDPEDDVVNYNTGESAEQPEVDLQGVLVWKEANGNWYMDVIMVRPANQTVTKSYSFAIYVKVTEENRNPLMDLVYGVHDGEAFQGQYDYNQVAVVDGTDDLVQLTVTGMPKFKMPAAAPFRFVVEAFYKATDDSSPTLYDTAEFMVGGR